MKHNEPTVYKTMTDTTITTQVHLALLINNLLTKDPWISSLL